MSAASTRPRDVAMASVLTIIGSVLALAGIFGAQGELRSSSVRREIGSVLADQRFATVDLSVDALLNLIEYGLMAAAAASVAAIVLAVFVMRRHNPSRIALTCLGGVATVFVLVSGLQGIIIAIFVAYTTSLLWRAPVRRWFAGVPAGAAAVDGSGADARRATAYWEMSGTGSGGTGPGGTGSGDTGADPWSGGAGPGGASPGERPGGEPEPSRNPDAVPDPDPHWPSDPAQPGSGPGPYPQPWPPEPDERGRYGQPGRHGQHGPYGQHPETPHPQPGPWGQQDQSGHPERPEHPAAQQPGAEKSAHEGEPGSRGDPGYPGPSPSEQQHGYGYPPAYPSAGQGHPGGVRGYPGGYPYQSGYGYPPAPGDPYRRPGQLLAAHVLTWVGAAFGLVTGVFFVVAASSQDVMALVEEQLAVGDVSRGEFTAMLVAAGVISVLWSLAVVAVSVFSWRGHNWAAIVLTVMGGGYLMVQLFTLLMGQLQVLFTIVWVAAVLTLLWWPGSRQWYAAQRTGRPGRHGPGSQGPGSHGPGRHGPGSSGPQNPYGPPGSGSPYQPPPHRNRPW